MTKEEELEKLKSIQDFLCTMNDDEFFNFFYENSASFREDIDAITNSVDVYESIPVVLNNDAEYSVRYRREEYVITENTYQPMTVGEMKWPIAA